MKFFNYRLTLVFLGYSMIQPTHGQGVDRRPHIVVIMGDDLGYGDLSCYGATKIYTPQIDRLAENGMRFTDAHSSSSLCSPSRYSLMTGRYSWRTHLKKGVLKWFAKPLIEEGRTTLGSLLQTQGYYTAYIGKWHLGFEWPLRADHRPADPDKEVFDTWERTSQDYIDFSKPVDQGPTRRGFDYYYGVAASNNMIPFVFLENDRVVAPPTVEKAYVYDTDQPKPRAPNWELEKLDQHLTKEAVRVIDDHFSSAEEQPLLLFFSTTAIHRPCLPTFTKGESRAGLRGDMVLEFDWTVHEVVDALKRNGIFENTLLIITSDNGAVPGDPVSALERYREDLGDTYYLDYFDGQVPEYVDPNGNQMGQQGWFTYNHASAGPFRGFKAGAWEGGHRIPLIMHWPAAIRAGQVNGNMVCNADLMATLADLTGYRGAVGEDSYSFLANVLGESAGQVRRSMVLASGRSGAFAARMGQWKYIAEADNHRDMADANPPDHQLYNMARDHGEQHNLYRQYPDTVAAIRALINNVKQYNKQEDLP